MEFPAADGAVWRVTPPTPKIHCTSMPSHLLPVFFHKCITNLARENMFCQCVFRTFIFFLCFFFFWGGCLKPDDKIKWDTFDIFKMWNRDHISRLNNAWEVKRFTAPAGSWTHHNSDPSWTAEKPEPPTAVVPGSHTWEESTESKVQSQTFSPLQNEINYSGVTEGIFNITTCFILHLCYFSLSCLRDSSYWVCCHFSCTLDNNAGSSAVS